ncbi:MAG: GtrA family protein [Polyangiaceae bacterium]
MVRFLAEMSPPTRPAPTLVTLLLRLCEVSVVRFGVVGVSNTVIGYTVFRGAHRVLPAAASQALSYLLGTLWSYYWNRRWTFKSQGNVASEAARFFSLQAGFLVLSASLLGLLVDHLHENPTVSWLGTAALCTVLNFVASRFWAFKPA